MVTIWNYYNAISCEQSTWSRILEAINLSLSEVITWKKSKKRNQTSQRSSGRHPSPAGRSIAGWSRRQICRTGKRESHAGSRNCSPARSSQPETQQRSAETDEDAVPACNHQKEQADMGKLKKVFADWWLCTQWPRWAVKWACKRWQGSQRLRFKFLSRRCNHSLSPFTAPAGTCRSLFQRSNIYNVLNIIYSISSILFSAHARLNSENQVQIKERCININNEFPHINAWNIINYLNFSISFANSTIKHHSTEYLSFPALCLYPVKHLTSIDTDH